MQVYGDMIQITYFLTAFDFLSGRFGWTARPKTASAFGCSAARQDAGEAVEDGTLIDARKLCNLYHVAVIPDFNLYLIAAETYLGIWGFSLAAISKYSLALDSLFSFS